mgnify:CR=1 FL=1
MEAREMIAIRGLTKTFGTGLDAVTALRDIDLSVRAGEIFGIIGLSGAGKSTLARRLAQLLPLELHDTDDEIAQSAGQTIPDLFKAQGEAAFRALESQAVAQAGSQGRLGQGSEGAAVKGRFHWGQPPGGAFGKGCGGRCQRGAHRRHRVRKRQKAGLHVLRTEHATHRAALEG